jgi:hypothetical protein
MREERGEKRGDRYQSAPVERGKKVPLERGERREERGERREEPIRSCRGRRGSNRLL